MASSARMLAAGVSAIWVIMCLYIYLIIVGPLFNKLVPFLHQNTPEYWWNYLNGGATEWMIPFVYTLIVLCGIIIIIRMFAEASRTVDYDTGGF
ncbi:MAG: hypothetical protein WC998_09800 [Candidatus Paceibacterota bacterium]|jgi:putative exporter of polyketide antibiotics